MSLSKITKYVHSPRHPSGMIEHLPRSVRDQLAVSRPVKLTRVDTVDRPKNVEFTEWLWENCQDHALEALNTGFIQGIKTGILDPTDYGGYTVQDAVYCFNATDYYKIAGERSSDCNMKAFIQSRVKSYTAYTEFMFKQWHIASPTAIEMGGAATSYTDFERNVAQTMDPFYLLLAMLPCEKLWEWLSQQIKSGRSDTNVYSFWITDNLGGSSKIATFVNENAEKYGVDHDKALTVYKGAMKGEAKFFTSATLVVE